MSTTITYPGGTAIQPDFVVVGSADSEVVSRTITHEILDGAPVYTLRPALPRNGTMELLFTSESRAHDALERLSAAAVYTVAGTDSPKLPSRFIPRTVRVAQHREVSVWTVTVDYEAVV